MAKRKVTTLGSKRRKAPPMEPETLQSWAEHYCLQRGFEWRFAVLNGCELVEDAAAQRQGYVGREGFVIHSSDPITGGPLTSGQIRHRYPPTYNGKERKFSQRKGTPSEPYFARCLDWKVAFKDVAISLVISEGPTRALAGAKQGLHVVSLTGVDCHGTGDELHPSLQRIKWKGRQVYISYDYDAQHNDRVCMAESKLAAKLAALGAEVHIVRLPCITPDGKAGLDDLLALSGGLTIFNALCAASPSRDATTTHGQTPVTICLEDIECKPVPWLWKNRLPFGMLVLLSGDPSGGKTFLALAVAASFSNGEVPWSREKCEPVTTIYMSNENSPAHVTKPRFIAQGGNPKRFHILSGSAGQDGIAKGISLSDIGVIEQAIIRTRARLLIIDPIQSYMGAGVDLHRSNETRPILDGIIALAERHNVCVIIIRHLAKSSGGRAIHKGLGSIDITGACRVEMLVGTAPDSPQERAIVQIKNNLGAYAPSLGFEITGKEMEAKLIWKGESALTAADLTAPDSGAKRKTQIELAKDYLREALSAGERLVKDLEDETELPLKVLQRASGELRLEKKRKGESGQWIWGLPKPSKFTRGGSQHA